MRELRYTISDNQLVAAVKDDRQWAVNRLYIKYLGMIKAYLRSKGATEEQAVECYHEAMLSVIRLSKEGILDRNEGSIAPFIKKVAWFQWQKALRREDKSVIHDSDRLANMDQPSDEGALNAMVDKEVSSQQQKQLHSALNSLTPKCRALIDLGFFADPPYNAQEIAKLLNFANANTVRVSKANCLKSLRNAFFAQ